MTSGAYQRAYLLTKEEGEVLWGLEEFVEILITDALLRHHPTAVVTSGGALLPRNSFSHRFGHHGIGGNVLGEEVGNLE